LLAPAVFFLGLICPFLSNPSPKRIVKGLP
jgi:hypothetical protein